MQEIRAGPCSGSCWRGAISGRSPSPRFLTDPTWGMLSFWVPLYLTTVRHFDLKHIALFAWLPFLAADLGCIFGPGVVLVLQRRGLNLIDARRWAFTLGAFMMIGVAFTGV